MITRGIQHSIVDTCPQLPDVFFLHSTIHLGVDNFSNQNMQNSVSQGAVPDNQTSSHTQIHGVFDWQVSIQAAAVIFRASWLHFDFGYPNGAV